MPFSIEKVSPPDISVSSVFFSLRSTEKFRKNQSEKCWKSKMTKIIFWFLTFFRSIFLNFFFGQFVLFVYNFLMVLPSKSYAQRPSDLLFLSKYIEYFVIFWTFRAFCTIENPWKPHVFAERKNHRWNTNIRGRNFFNTKRQCLYLLETI